MKIVFIKNKYQKLNLTLYKIYTVNYVDNLWYEITDDNGYLIWVDISDFITLSEYRNNQIDSIIC